MTPDSPEPLTPLAAYADSSADPEDEIHDARLTDPEQSPPKLTKAQAATIKRRILMGLKANDLHLKRPAEKALAIYRGELWPHPEVALDQHRITVNLAPHIIRTRVESYAFSSADHFLEPLNRSAAARTPIAESAIRYEWRRAQVQAEMRRIALDRELYGFGVVYTGWLAEAGDLVIEDGRPPIQGEERDAPPDEASSETPVASAAVKEDRFLVRRIHPRTFFIDPACDCDLDNAAFYGYTELRPIDAVKRDPRFRNTRDLKGSSKCLSDYIEDELKHKKDEEVPSDLRRVRLAHFFEPADRLHVVMAIDESDKPLLVERWPWQHRHGPFVLLGGDGDGDSIFSEPMILRIADQLREVALATSAIHQHMLRFNRAYAVPRGLLDPQAKKQLRSSQDGRIVEHNGGPNDKIQPIEHAALQPEVYAAAQTAEKHIQAITGLDQYQAFLSAPSKRVVGPEVEAITQGAGPRAQADVTSFSQACSQVARICLAFLQQYSVVTRSLPIYDPAGQVREWRDVTPRDIQGEWDIVVHVSPAQPFNRNTEVKDLGFLLQSLQPFMQAGLVDPRPLLGQLLRAVPGIRDIDEILKPALPPSSGPSPSLRGVPAGPPGGPGPGGPSGPPPALPPGAPPQAALPPALPPGLPPALLQAIQAGLVPAPVVQEILSGHPSPEALAFLQQLLLRLQQSH